MGIKRDLNANNINHRPKDEGMNAEQRDEIKFCWKFTVVFKFSIYFYFKFSLPIHDIASSNYIHYKNYA